jgi:hypothetical protein
MHAIWFSHCIYAHSIVTQAQSRLLRISVVGLRETEREMQENFAWASRQDTRDEPKFSTDNQGVEQPGGTTQWHLPCSLACILSLAWSLSKTQGQYHTAQNTYIYLWKGFPSLCSVSHALSFHTLISCSAALCHAASVKRLWCPYPCMGRGVSAKRENERYSHIVDPPGSDCPCRITTQ